MPGRIVLCPQRILAAPSERAEVYLGIATFAEKVGVAGKEPNFDVIG
jgi:hypothetical protein